MKNFIVISIFFTFLFNGVTVYGAEPEEDCDKNQATMNRCAESEFVELDNELNSLYKQKMETLKSREYRKYLKIAEISWIEFRDKDCTYQLGPPQDRGSIHIMRKYKCMSKHTSRRIEDLKAYIDCTQNGCPH